MRYRWECVWSQDGKCLQGNPIKAEMHCQKSPGQALLSPVTKPTNPASAFETYKFRSLKWLTDNSLRTARQRSSSQQCHRNRNRDRNMSWWVFVHRHVCAFSLLHRYLWTDRRTDKPEHVFPQSTPIFLTQQGGSSRTNTSFVQKHKGNTWCNELKDESTQQHLEQSQAVPGSKNQTGSALRGQEGTRKEPWEAKGHGEGDVVATGDTSGPAFVKIDTSLQIPNAKLRTWDL